MDEQARSRIEIALHDAGALRWGPRRAAELRVTQTTLVEALATVESASLELEDEPDFIVARHEA